jgi:hypothetical protein
MVYATGTLAATTTPAKDMMAVLQTTLTTGGLSLVESYSQPASASWTAVAFGNSTFVSVAYNSATAATSPDGTTWTQRTLPLSATWQLLTYGAGLFVAVAYNTNIVATSPDGITWTLRTLPATSTWSAITYGNGLFVAVATGSNVAVTSPDGITWTAQTLPAVSPWQAVAYGAGVFVVVATSVQNCATSADGVTWTLRSLPSPSGWTAIAFGNSTFVVTSNGNPAATSPDGITWTARTLPVPYNWVSVTYGSTGGFLAVTSSGYNVAAQSTNGITWTTPTMPSAAAWSGVAYGASKYVAIASSSVTSANSPDGVTWTARNMTGSSQSSWADVYKSPAASNQFGSDWYLLLRRAADTSAFVYFQVAETYNTSTHMVTNIGGTGGTVVPTTTTYQNPFAGQVPDASTVYGTSAYLVVASLLAQPYWISATANRVIVGVRGATTEFGFYAGLYDDLLPTGVTQFPLGCAKLPVTASLALGNGTAANAGGFTREPLQTVGAVGNFEAAIHNGYSGFQANTGFLPLTSSSPVYGNPGSVSRVPIGSLRSATMADAMRGLLIGCVVSQATSISGDSITANNKTYVRFAGPNVNYGYFVDTAL